MPFAPQDVRPGPSPRTVLTADGTVLRVPEEWALLPPGDAALSRRIKRDGPSWVVTELKGRKRFSRGIWAPGARLNALRAELAAERCDPAYARKLESGRQRRAAEQLAYAEEFVAAVREFLGFAALYAREADVLAGLIAAHAVPVGSGTVARTQRIPLAQRAEAATLAWMRHQTTEYDRLAIQRVKGARREVRRRLAQRSREVLDRYRRGEPVSPGCPLQRVLPPLPMPEPRQTTLSFDAPRGLSS